MQIVADNCPRSSIQPQSADKLRRQWLKSPWLLIAVLGLVAFLRFWHLADWSLWEDEETTIFFSQNTNKPFPSYFPVFFVVLNWLYTGTGISVGAGRALSAAVGILSIALVGLCFRRFIPRSAALLACLLLGLSLGHLFWSQSIRYFTMLLVFQILAMHWFLRGFEKQKHWDLVLSNVAFVLALLTHFSAVLLAPVFVGYLLLIPVWRGSIAKYSVKSYLTFAIPFMLIMALFAGRFREASQALSGMSLASARDPLHVLATVGAYAGIPIMALGLLSPFLVRQIPRRITVFFFVAGFLPILELLVIAKLNVVNVTWYYGFFMLVGLTISASLVLVALYKRGWRFTAVLLGTGTVIYYVGFLSQYYTSMHGDRPRWEEAAAFLRRETDISVGGENNPKVFATVPGVVAFYLGVEPGQTMGNPLVTSLPAEPTDVDDVGNQWFVVEASVVPCNYVSWFKEHCVLKAEFPAQTGPKDRTVLVYYLPAVSQ